MAFATGTIYSAWQWSPELVETTFKTELRRRQITRWAMISRKMKHEEPPNDLHMILREANPDYTGNPRMIPYLTKLLTSKVGKEASFAASCLGYMNDRWGYTKPADMLRLKKKCIASGAVANLISLLQFDNRRQLENVLSALSHIADGDAECRTALIKLGAIPRLVDLLYREDEDITIKSSASKIFWWLSVHGNLECKKACIKEGAIEALEDCCKTMSSRKYACYDNTYTREALYALQLVNGGV
jgi:hypothetical protein